MDEKKGMEGRGERRTGDMILWESLVSLYKIVDRCRACIVAWWRDRFGQAVMNQCGRGTAQILGKKSLSSKSSQIPSLPESPTVFPANTGASGQPDRSTPSCLLLHEMPPRYQSCVANIIPCLELHREKKGRGARERDEQLTQQIKRFKRKKRAMIVEQTTDQIKK